MRSAIICVDDEKMLLNILVEQLSQWFGTNYMIEKAISGDDALAILDECKQSNTDVSVVISDYIMPNMKGDELLSKVTQIDNRIRKIMLTGYSSIDGIVSAINNGGLYRYLTKPWDTKDLMLTVLEAIKSYESEKKANDLSKGFEALYLKYEKMCKVLETELSGAMRAIISAVEERDPSFGNTKTVSLYAQMLGKALKMSEDDLKSLEIIANLKNVGIIGLSDDELNQYKNIDKYSNNKLIGKQSACAVNIVSNMNRSESFVHSIKYQYEKFDGTGYYGLKGVKIPITASIIGLADFFADAKNELSNSQQFSLDAIIEKLESTKGSLFPPFLVDMFVRLIKAKPVI